MLLMLLDEETGRKLIIIDGVENTLLKSRGAAENIINSISDAVDALPNHPIVTYDPIKDHDNKTQYTLEEFVTVATTDLRRFEKDTNSIKKTWQDWMQSFLGWMSW